MSQINASSEDIATREHVHEPFRLNLNCYGASHEPTFLLGRPFKRQRVEANLASETHQLHPLNALPARQGKVGEQSGPLQTAHAWETIADDGDPPLSDGLASSRHSAESSSATGQLTFW